MARACFPALLAALLAVTSACGGGEGAPDDPATLLVEWGDVEKRYVPIDPPVVEHVRGDRPEARPFVVYVASLGDSGHLPGLWLLASGSREEWTASLVEFGVALDEACAEPGRRSGAGTCRVPLRVNADVWVPWSYVEDVFRRALDVPARIERVEWWVRSSSTLHDVHQEATLVRAARPSDPLAIEIRGRRLESDGSEVTLSVADWSRTVRDDADSWFTRVQVDPRPADPLDVWKGAVAVVQEQAGEHDGIELRITGEPEGVAWRHVVRVFDLLLGAGLREVDLPSLEARLVFAEPEDTSRPPFVYPGDPVATPVVVVLAVFMVLGAFVLTFLPLWFERSARKRPARP